MTTDYDIISSQRTASSLLYLQRAFSPSSTYGVGDIDGEGIERFWSKLTPFIGGSFLLVWHLVLEPFLTLNPQAKPSIWDMPRGVSLSRIK